MELTTLWIILIAVLWCGYFVLEGFDFGVGMLLPVVAKDEAERRAVITTLGPVWDGNEVWLLVAGGATFAAFPEWYATLFSGFYLPLFIILIALIVRGVSFEYRSKRSSPTWRRNWDIAIVGASFVPSLLWGVAFANLVRGVPLVTNPAGGMTYDGGFFNLLNPFAILGGLTTLTLFLTHGAVFLALKADGDIRTRARAFATKSGAAAAVLAVAFLLWTQVAYSDKAWTWALVIIAAVAWVGGIMLNLKGREGWSFLLSTITLIGAVAFLFSVLYPFVMPNIDGRTADNSLTITNASSTPYTLKIMTIVAIIFVPIVLAYQAWTYWVFRKRVSPADIPHPEAGSLDYPEEAAAAAAAAAKQ